MQGLILLNKPSGITSFGAVAKIRKLTGEKRVGHTGTLDPMAVGVLPILLGRATCLSSYILEADKSYTATVKLGITTDTEDITGKVLTEKPVNITNEQLINALKKFTGEISQVPPMYSAIKKDGVPMYKLARKGETAQIEPRVITVFSINLEKPLYNNEFTATVVCSKGTYIRSLFRDIGEFLECGATLTALCRNSSFGFEIDKCVNLDDLTEDNIKDYIISEEKAVSNLREVFVTEKQAVRFSNGGQLSLDRIKFIPQADNENIRVKYNGILLGIGYIDLKKQQIGIKCILNGSDRIV